jgi:hypothetical protein
MAYDKNGKWHYPGVTRKGDRWCFGVTAQITVFYVDYERDDDWGEAQKRVEARAREKMEETFGSKDNVKADVKVTEVGLAWDKTDPESAGHHWCEPDPRSNFHGICHTIGCSAECVPGKTRCEEHAEDKP